MVATADHTSHPAIASRLYPPPSPLPFPTRPSISVFRLVSISARACWALGQHRASNSMCGPRDICRNERQWPINQVRVTRCCSSHSNAPHGKGAETLVHALGQRSVCVCVCVVASARKKEEERVAHSACRTSGANMNRTELN